MNAAEQVKHFENLVNQEWNNATTVGAWRDWSDEQAIHCQPLTDGLIEHAQLGTGLNVLDIAGGVGQPAFPIAKIVGPTGAVVATDLSPGMLDVAAIEARKQDIQNVEFRVADAHQLPFDDGEFDRVVSRLGLMYFWDIDRAIREIYRVLKPGGVGSFVVWGADDKNQFFASILAPFMNRREMPVPPPDAPTPTRFGDITNLVKSFENAGFSDVSAQERCEPLPWPGDPASLFRHFYDMAVPMQAYLDSFSEAELEVLLQEVEQNLLGVFDGTHTRAVASFNVISVTK